MKYTESEKKARSRLRLETARKRLLDAASLVRQAALGLDFLYASLEKEEHFKGRKELLESISALKAIYNKKSVDLANSVKALNALERQILNRPHLFLIKSK